VALPKSLLLIKLYAERQKWTELNCNMSLQFSSVQFISFALYERRWPINVPLLSAVCVKSVVRISERLIGLSDADDWASWWQATGRRDWRDVWRSRLCSRPTGRCADLRSAELSCLAALPAVHGKRTDSCLLVKKHHSQPQLHAAVPSKQAITACCCCCCYWWC